MDKLFADIENQLNSSLNDLRWIDWDFGQLSQSTPPVAWPCCLIDFPAAQYSNEGNYRQLGDTTITLRLGFKVYERSHNKANPVYKAQALEHLQLIKDIQKELQGLEGEIFSPLIRTSFTRVPSIKHREYIITYRTVLYDDSGSKPLIKKPRPNLIIEEETL